jgi:hypothetical protein
LGGVQRGFLGGQTENPKSLRDLLGPLETHENRPKDLRENFTFSPKKISLLKIRPLPRSPKGVQRPFFSSIPLERPMMYMFFGRESLRHVKTLHLGSLQSESFLAEKTG